MSFTRIVFKSNEEAQTIRTLSVNHFWTLTKLVRADPENRIPYELHFKADEGDLEVVYVEDPISECSYAIVRGDDAEGGCALIREKARYWTAEEMFADWDGAPHDTAQILAILRIGVGAPEQYDARFAGKLKEGLASEDYRVREATLAAIGYADWKEVDAVLKDIAEHDPHERCRNRAAVMLQIREEERGT